MIIEVTERCTCGSFLKMYEGGGRWHVACLTQCYDPDEDATGAAVIVGSGETPGDALIEYLRLREDADAEPRYVPTGLDSFVVPRKPPGFGFTMRVINSRGDLLHVERVYDLSEAESFAARTTTGEILPIYYGLERVEPATPAQRAANDG